MRRFTNRPVLNGRARARSRTPLFLYRDRPVSADTFRDRVSRRFTSTARTTGLLTCCLVGFVAAPAAVANTYPYAASAQRDGVTASGGSIGVPCPPEICQIEDPWSPPGGPPSS
jgi:hypothetical protein